MYVARMMIANFLDGGVFSADLRSCRIYGTALIEALDKVISNTENRELSIFEIYPITNAFAQFRTAMLAEIGVLPSFFVTQKGGFHTITLLDQGEKLFPDDLHQKAPEAIFDIKQAAMSLAYELATAAGFHAFRATESVLRRYYTHVSGGQPLPKVRNIGVYIRGLRKANCGDETILASLEQLAKLHGNPVIHPEAVLTIEEAISTVGMSRSVVAAMLKELPILPQLLQPLRWNNFLKCTPKRFAALVCLYLAGSLDESL